MKVVKAISIDEEKWKLLQQVAKTENRSASNFVEFLLQKYIEETKKRRFESYGKN